MEHTLIKVYPKNWEKNLKSNLSKEWYIYYEFRGKHIRFKNGINYCKTLEEKQALVRQLIAEEYRNLKNGLNPITKEYETSFTAVNEKTPFISALKIAASKIKVSENTLKSINNTIKIIEEVSVKTGHSSLEIATIRKRDVRLMMDEVLEMGYSNDKYNKIKAYLGILYNYLVDLEIFEHNYIHYIRKLPHTPKRREIFREEDIEKLNQLKNHHYGLWRFLVIFHSSQSQESIAFTNMCGKMFDVPAMVLFSNQENGGNFQAKIEAFSIGANQTINIPVKYFGINNSDDPERTYIIPFNGNTTLYTLRIVKDNQQNNPPVIQTEHYFDKKLYKERYAIERSNAWMDSFRSVLNRFDTTVSSWIGFNYLAFIVLGLRKFKQKRKSR